MAFWLGGSSQKNVFFRFIMLPPKAEKIIWIANSNMNIQFSNATPKRNVQEAIFETNNVLQFRWKRVLKSTLPLLSVVYTVKLRKE